jgi:hypothetical protein
MESKNNKNVTIVLTSKTINKYGIINRPYCFSCVQKNPKKIKGIRRGVFRVQFNGLNIYLCKYCYQHKRKTFKFLKQLKNFA